MRLFQLLLRWNCVQNTPSPELLFLNYVFPLCFHFLSRFESKTWKSVFFQVYTPFFTRLRCICINVMYFHKIRRHWISFSLYGKWQASDSNFLEWYFAELSFPLFLQFMSCSWPKPHAVFVQVCGATLTGTTKVPVAGGKPTRPRFVDSSRR